MYDIDAFIFYKLITSMNRQLSMKLSSLKYENGINKTRNKSNYRENNVQINGNGVTGVICASLH